MRQRSHWQGLPTPENRKRGGIYSAAPLILRKRLEGQLSSKLEHARIPRAGDLPEVALDRPRGVHVVVVPDVLEFRMVPGVEGFKAELEADVFVDWKCLEERGGEVRLTGAEHRILASIPETLVDAA